MGNKGYRRDVQCREVFIENGFAIEKSVSERYGRTDWFGLVDFMAVRPDSMWFVQVKSNASGGAIGEFSEWCDEHAPGWLNCIVAICHDNEGWRVVDVNTDDKKYTTLLDERKHDGNMGELFREFVSELPRD